MIFVDDTVVAVVWNEQFEYFLEHNNHIRPTIMFNIEEKKDKTAFLSLTFWVEN